MRGEWFWKGIITFCLTLLIGTFAVELFNSAASKVENEKTDLFYREKTCVFADSELKYQILPLREESHFTPSANETKKIILTPISATNRAKSEPTNAQNDGFEPQMQKYMPSQNTTEFQTLLHIEKCYESDGRN